MRIGFLLLIFFLPLSSVGGQVVINEVLTLNRHGVTDEDGDPSDWVELLNLTTDTVDLEGYALSDNPDEPRRWQLPRLVLAPREYLVVWCSGKDRRDPAAEGIHTSFKLKAGETVVLTSPDERVEDFVGLPVQNVDQSYGRAPDGTGLFFYHRDPSPGLENTGPTSSETFLTAVPTFSMPRGFYDAPFEVELESEPGTQIRYTLDGSLPAPGHGLLYTSPVSIAGTTTLRAVAYEEEFTPSQPVTHTYLFPASVLAQPVMRPDVVQDPVLGPQIEEALRAIPVVSITLDGEVQNDVESEASVEFLRPDGGEEFQIQAGIRNVGGASIGFPKNNMRLYFRGRYGATKLEFPLFADVKYGEGAADTFDQLQLRSGSHDSIFYLAGGAQHPASAQYIRNRWMSDLQFEMGHLSLHGRFVHLYINGIYWGHYHLMERPHDSFFASYLGGEEEDYEAVNRGSPVGDDAPAWGEILTLRDDFTEIERLVDLDNLADYMILNFYAGNSWDWSPGQNWMAGGPRQADAGGYKFFAWDSDIILVRTDANNVRKGGPASLFDTFLLNEEFRVRFGDRVQRHFFGGGLLTPGRVAETYNLRAREIFPTIVVEEARWQHDSSWSRDTDWQQEWDRLRDDFFPRRTDIVVKQLTDQGWLSAMPAPSFSPQRGIMTRNFRPGEIVELTSTLGDVYVTLDGTDPRLPGGAVSPAATRLEVSSSVYISPSDEARIFVPFDDSSGRDWIQPDFDDSSWQSGAAGIGYDTRGNLTDRIHNDVESLLRLRNASVYVRVPFTVDEPAAVSTLTLLLEYDDGVVAYLNGEEILSSHAPSDLTWDARATLPQSTDPASLLDHFDLTEHLGLLRPGRNVLAFHGLNFRSSDRDFLLSPRLIGGTGREVSIPITETTTLRARALLDGIWSSLNESTYVVEPALRLTEIMYQPAEGEGLEFLELYNGGSDTFDLAGLRLEGAVRFDFSGAAFSTLEPGATLLVVENESAFAALHDLRTMNIAGEYSGRLANEGETLRLRGALDEVILEVTYDDSWYPSTSGGGYSLVPDPSGGESGPSDAASWRPSPRAGGSPGEFEGDEALAGLQLPGDADQSGRVNLIDAVTVLRRVLGRADAPLPCEGARLDEGGNRVLLDVNGDRRVNLADVTMLLGYVFREGPPPTLGARCVPMAGCPSLCAP